MSWRAAWVAVDIGPVTPESTQYPAHGEAVARVEMIEKLEG